MRYSSRLMEHIVSGVGVLDKSCALLAVVAQGPCTLADLSELDIVFVVLGRGDWLVADGAAPAAPAEAAP